MEALDVLEWWRVVETQRARGTRLIFIEEDAAEGFARYLAGDDRTERVLLEHWRDGVRIDTRMVLEPHPN